MVTQIIDNISFNMKELHDFSFLSNTVRYFAFLIKMTQGISASEQMTNDL